MEPILDTRTGAGSGLVSGKDRHRPWAGRATGFLIINFFCFPVDSSISAHRHLAWCWGISPHTLRKVKHVLGNEKELMLALGAHFLVPQSLHQRLTEENVDNFEAGFQDIYGVYFWAIHESPEPRTVTKTTAKPEVQTCCALLKVTTVCY